MKEPKENGSRVFEESYSDAFELSNVQNFKLPVGKTSEERDLRSHKATQKSDLDDEKVGTISKIPKQKNDSHNKVDAESQLTLPSKNIYNGVTSAQRRKREAKASRHVAFNSTILCPLCNLGNTCYFNSGIQILSNCPAFVFGLRDVPHCYATCQKSLFLFNQPNNTDKHTLFQLLANLLYNMEYETLEKGKSISPFRVVDQLAKVFSSFEGRRQQDCPEMIDAVLVTIEDVYRLEIEVNDLLQSFEVSAQTYEKKKTLRLNNDFHIMGNRSINMTGSFPNSNSMEFSMDHNLLDQTRPSSVCSREIFSGPRSAHFIAILRLMQKVNEENRELERKAAERKGKTYDPRNSFYPPRLVFNPTTGGFKGYMLSEIRCHNCSNVSRVVNSFSSLILEIPSQRQRYEFAKRNPNIKRLDANGKLFQNRKHPDVTWWNPLSHFYYFYRRFYNYIFSCFSSINYALTLKECLDIHFEPVELKGGNKYQCESCGGLHEATKSEFLLSLPEYLFIHMKRFKMNTFAKGKNSDPVIFPVSWTPFKNGTPWEEIQKLRFEILDLRPYMHPTVNANVNPIQSCLHTNGEDQDDDTMVSVLPESQLIPSTYTLDGIVNHHGSITSGHYAVFTHKRLNNKDLWLQINDDEIEAVSLSSVADSEEYLLSYRCQPVMELTEEFVQLRDKARYYLLESRITLEGCDDDSEKTRKSGNHTSHRHHHDTEVECKENKDNVVYISSMWLQRVAFFHDPGPIINRFCYTSFRSQKELERQTGFSTAGSRIPESLLRAYGPPVRWYYAEIDEVDYSAFYEAYGGDGAVTRAQYEALKKDQDILVNLLQNKSI
ncbi:unnamed protein product [Phytomonas sp. Hart1]|nr:unnamed protein product [Phytomonas sp. Hart1]|eukprot:CCW69550.1 unnamed protein product [Phytomonas sp. isolate Hart1]